ncbi:NAD-dependent epimerase/dehydratase family protein [Deinococcus radiopugnans]|uniref:NAD-dependent epimerase/dehydratase family protein n=1 Tax=Deinococcus radiopugnans TaxID=57497 RepID=UPI0036155BA6
MRLTDRIYVAGHGGLVGSALLRRLKADGYSNVLTCSSRELDLRDQGAALAFLRLSARSTCSWRRPRWAASTPTAPAPPSSSTTT